DRVVPPRADRHVPRDPLRLRRALPPRGAGVIARGRVESLFVRARAGERDAVVAELRAAIAASRDDDEAWLALGLVLADAGRWSDAIEPLVRACAAAGAPEIARATLTHAWLMALE